MKKLTLFLSLAVVLSFAVVAKAQAPMSYRVDTINDLIGITLYGSDAKAIAYVGGGTARNDGLGGLFFYDGTSSQTTNTYAVYKPTSVTTGRWFKLPTSVVNQQTDVTVADEATYAWKLLDGNAANAFSIGLTSANVYMQTWGSKPLYINSSLGGNNTIINLTGGNVGIGTATPGSLLHINNDSGAATYERLLQGRSAVNNSFSLGAGGNDIYFAAAGGGGLHFAVNSDLGVTGASVPSNVVMTILTGGNVGIGTATPAAKLAVNGGAHVGGDSDPGDNNLSVDGTSTLTGTVAIGSGTPIAKVVSATDTLDFGNTATLTSTDLTITVTGAAVGDSVAIGLPAAPDANGCFTGWVSAANTVTVRFNNYSAGSIDPASATYRATVTQF
jgi:hypothetical protein